MPRLKTVDPFRRGNKRVLVRQKLVPMGIHKQRKKAGLALQFIRDVEAALPGATGTEKKAWVKDQIDAVFALPPIAEEISDFTISLTVECAYAGVQAAKKSGTYTDDLATAKKEIRSLKAKIKRLEKKVGNG